MRLRLCETPSNVKPRWTKRGPVCSSLCPSYSHWPYTHHVCHHPDRMDVQPLVGDGDCCPFAVSAMAEKMRDDMEGTDG